MIEKLSEYKIIRRDCGNFINVENNTKIINTLVQKINELVDTVDELQAHVAILEEHAHPTAKTTDQYAEQRKWIGKLCKFWDDRDCNKYHYGILSEIDENRPHPYWVDGDWSYEHCKPVSEYLIYKGE